MKAGAAVLAPEVLPGHAEVNKRCPVCGNPAVLTVALITATVDVNAAGSFVAMFGKVVEVKHARISADFECAGPTR